MKTIDNVVSQLFKKTTKTNNNSVSSWIRKIKIALLIFVMGGIFYFIKKFINVKTKMQKTKQINSNCNKVPESETIFVSLPCLKDIKECVETIKSIFSMAYCPFRVYVGIYQNTSSQIYDHNNDDIDGHLNCCFKAYKKLCLDENMIDFSKNIRLFNDSENENVLCPLYARYMIQKNLFRQEQYYLVTKEGLLFIKDWDKHCIELFKRNCSANNNNSITQTFNTSADIDKNNCHDFILSHRVINQSSPKDDTKNDDTKLPPTFTRISGWTKYGTPKIESQSMHSVAVKAFDTLIWSSDFSFCESKLMLSVPFDPFMYVKSSDADWIHGIRLWTSGFDFRIPNTCFVFMSNRKYVRKNHIDDMYGEFSTCRSDVNTTTSTGLMDRFNFYLTKGYTRLRTLLRIIEYNPQQKYSSLNKIELYDLGKNRSIIEFQNKLGINWNTFNLTTHAKLGLSTFFTPDELMSKYGSWSNLYSMMNDNKFINK